MSSTRVAAALLAVRWVRLWLVLPLIAALWFAVRPAFAQDADPPGRVATLSFRQGSIVFAPEGEDEWQDLPQNRPVTVGDRMWTDRGARAELHLGPAVVHLDAESHLGVSALDANAAQFILLQGRVAARVREIGQGENFEIDTPHLAFRAVQPGEFRIDVDPQGRWTRIVVESGSGVVFGEGGQSVDIGAGQAAAFSGRFLAQAQVPAARQDDFVAWSAQRNRDEDRSLAARYVPRGVVGYSQLDAYGSWAQDPDHGAVWFPTVTVDDWAPYRYGRWSWIEPWGWTWIDEAPWGFAPFHYGRWAQIGSRWAWVPGSLAARPVYAPALVVFMGGGGSSLNFAGGPGVGWYPLAPGEAWYPNYRVSSRYLGGVNRNINLSRYPRGFSDHYFRHRPGAVTAVPLDDFRGGRSLRGHWSSVAPSAAGQAQIGVAPARPNRGEWREWRERNAGSAPRLQAVPPSAQQFTAPSREWGGRGGERREADRGRDTNDRGNREAWDRGRDDRGNREGWDRRQRTEAPATVPQVQAPAQPERDRGPDWQQRRAAEEQQRRQQQAQQQQAAQQQAAQQQAQQQAAQQRAAQQQAAQQQAAQQQAAQQQAAQQQAAQQRAAQQQAQQQAAQRQAAQDQAAQQQIQEQWRRRQQELQQQAAQPQPSPQQQQQAQQQAQQQRLEAARQIEQGRRLQAEEAQRRMQAQQQPAPIQRAQPQPQPPQGVMGAPAQPQPQQQQPAQREHPEHRGRGNEQRDEQRQRGG